MNGLEKLLVDKYKLEMKSKILKFERNKLISNCSLVSEQAQSLAEQYDIDTYGDYPCLTVLFHVTQKMNHENSDSYSFKEVLYEYGCDNCKNAYELKRGDIAKTNIEIGRIKKKLTNIAKRLIKIEVKNETKLA